MKTRRSNQQLLSLLQARAGGQTSGSPVDFGSNSARQDDLGLGQDVEEAEELQILEVSELEEILATFPTTIRWAIEAIGGARVMESLPKVLLDPVVEFLSGDDRGDAVKGVVATKSGVILPAVCEGTLQALATRFANTEAGASYFERTGYHLMVTDGVRTPADQAGRMWTKYQLGGLAELRAIYRNADLLEPIIQALEKALEAKTAPVAAMPAVIEGQVASGSYISKHLVADAVDIRCHDLTDEEEAEITDCALNLSGIGNWLREYQPPHFHCAFN